MFIKSIGAKKDMHLIWIPNGSKYCDRRHESYVHDLRGYRTRWHIGGRFVQEFNNAFCGPWNIGHEPYSWPRVNYKLCGPKGWSIHLSFQSVLYWIGIQLRFVCLYLISNGIYFHFFLFKLKFFFLKKYVFLSFF